MQSCSLCAEIFWRNYWSKLLFRLNYRRSHLLQMQHIGTGTGYPLNRIKSSVKGPFLHSVPFESSEIISDEKIIKSEIQSANTEKSFPCTQKSSLVFLFCLFFSLRLINSRSFLMALRTKKNFGLTKNKFHKKESHWYTTLTLNEGIFYGEKVIYSRS